MRSVSMKMGTESIANCLRSDELGSDWLAENILLILAIHINLKLFFEAAKVSQNPVQ